MKVSTGSTPFESRLLSLDVLSETETQTHAKEFLQRYKDTENIV